MTTQIHAQSPSEEPKKIPVWSWRHAIEAAPVTEDTFDGDGKSMFDGLRPLTKLVLMMIANDVSDCGKFSRKTIVDLQAATGLGRTAVIEHIKRARICGFLEVKRSRNAAGHVIGTRYYPRFPAGYVLATAAAAEPETQSSPGGPRQKPKVRQATRQSSPGEPRYKDTFPQTSPRREDLNISEEERRACKRRMEALAMEVRSASAVLRM